MRGNESALLNLVVIIKAMIHRGYLVVWGTDPSCKPYLSFHFDLKENMLEAVKEINNSKEKKDKGNTWQPNKPFKYCFSFSDFSFYIHGLGISLSLLMMGDEGMLFEQLSKETLALLTNTEEVGLNEIKSDAFDKLCKEIQEKFLCVAGELFITYCRMNYISLNGLPAVKE